VAEGTLRVRFFAGARAAAGTPEAGTARADGDRVSDVLGRLQAEHPGLAAVVPACSFLLDGVAARHDTPVGTAATLDVLPPFSGG
jgi:molybdopterin synthase sulfur carrier subunit